MYLYVVFSISPVSVIAISELLAGTLITLLPFLSITNSLVWYGLAIFTFKYVSPTAASITDRDMASSISNGSVLSHEKLIICIAIKTINATFFISFAFFILDQEGD
ncbi:MAG: hypothetical protein M0P71_16430, partial [Melioribacteraceae bacterium]|nr:hypothetical protein [Melioribacteraceae bacterium]